MELKECMKDALEENMQSYQMSQQYIEQRQTISREIAQFRNTLDQQQIQGFNYILDLISTCDAEFAAEAYVRGIVEGIAVDLYLKLTQF